MNEIKILRMNASEMYILEFDGMVHEYIKKSPEPGIINSRWEETAKLTLDLYNQSIKEDMIMDEETVKFLYENANEEWSVKGTPKYNREVTRYAEKHNCSTEEAFKKIYG